MLGSIGGMLPVLASTDYSWVNSPASTLVALAIGCTWMAFERRQASVKNDEWMQKFIAQNERVTLAVERSTAAIEDSTKNSIEVKHVLENCRRNSIS